MWQIQDQKLIIYQGTNRCFERMQRSTRKLWGGVPAPAILLSLSVLVYTWAWGIQSGRETNRFDPLAISTHSPNLHLMKLHDSLKSSWSPYSYVLSSVQGICHSCPIPLPCCPQLAGGPWGTPELLQLQPQPQPCINPGRPLHCFCKCKQKILQQGTAGFRI